MTARFSSFFRSCFRRRARGFTLVELLVAIGIGSVVIITATAAVMQVTQIQKRLQVSQNFHEATRLLVERLSQDLRHQTIDYQQYWLQTQDPSNASGPWVTSGCSSRSGMPPTPRYLDSFLWDTNNNNTPDRQLGGLTLGGTPDPCSLALSSPTQSTLHLTNGTHTLRTRYTFTAPTVGPPATPGTLSRQQFAALDTSGDGQADTWATTLQWDTVNSLCKGQNPADSSYKTILDFRHKTDESWCRSFVGTPTVISPDSLSLTALSFTLHPARDPYLSYQLDTTQLQPFVQLQLTTQLLDADQWGFDPTTPPTLDVQTTVTSRLYGSPYQPQ